MIADFSENCSVVLPEEATAAHFASTQTTLYPVMVYRTADGVIQDGFYVISDDLRHDYHASSFIPPENIETEAEKYYDTVERPASRS